MSEFESARSTGRIAAAIVVIVIVGVAGVIGFMSLTGTGPFGPGTTPTGTTTTNTTAAGITLTILTRHDVSIHSVFEPAFLATDFAKQHGITDILWKTPSAEFWDDLIDAGQVDVCWGGGPTLFDQLMRDDRLAPLNSTHMQQVAARVNDTIAGVAMKRYNSHGDLVWVAAAISTFGFTVNHAFLDEYSLPVPHKWTDLANATYGKYLKATPTIAMGNAPDTTSNTRIYEIITQALGWEEGWITMARMAGNARIYGGSVETQTAAENGDVGVSMSIDFYGYLTQYRNPDCEYIVPTGQSIVNGDPIAIPATTDKRELAEGFLDFVLSPEGQALWLDNRIRRMPVMEEAFHTPAGEDAQDLYAVYNMTIENKGIDFNDTLSLEINMAFITYFEAVFTRAHTELVNCWELMAKAYLDGHLTEEQLNSFAAQMGTPVTIQDPKTGISHKFTVEYARMINNMMIYDPTYAAAVESAWTTAAKIQYNNVHDAVAAVIPAS